MAEKLKKNSFEEKGVNPFNAPTPGESLTSSPDMQKGWERPPEFTEVSDAMESLYMEVTAEDKLFEIIKLIDNKQPLDEMAQVILYRGYTQGMYTPDLMLLMIEPTLYLLIAIADYAKIDDYVLYEGEDTDPDAQIHGDDEEPIMMDDDNEIVEERPQPKKESLGPSLLAKVEKELPAKVREVKEKE